MSRAGDVHNFYSWDRGQRGGGYSERGRKERVRYVLSRAKGATYTHFCESRGTYKLFWWPSGDRMTELNIAGTAPRAGTATEGFMVVSYEEVAALRVKLEREKKDLEIIRRERSSFDGLGVGNSSDRRGTAASTMGPMWTRGVSAAGDLRQNLPNFPRGIVPKFPVECSPSEYIAWERRFEFFIADQGLRHTISLDAPDLAIISCTNNA